MGRSHTLLGGAALTESAETVQLFFAKSAMLCNIFPRTEPTVMDHLQVSQLLWSSPDVWLHQGTHQDRT